MLATRIPMIMAAQTDPSQLYRDRSATCVAPQLGVMFGDALQVGYLPRSREVGVGIALASFWHLLGALNQCNRDGYGSGTDGRERG